MAIKTHKVTLSLDNPRVIQSGINVQSFDKQSIQISIELTKNDEVFQVPNDATIRVSLLKLANQSQRIIVDVPNTNRDSIDWIVPDYLDGYQGAVRVGVYLVSGTENVDLGYFTILSNVSDIDKMADEFTDNVFQGWEAIEADLNELNLTIAQAESDLNDILTTADGTIANINAKNTQVNTLASDVTSKYNAFDTSVTQAGQTIDDILALQPQSQSVLDETTGKDVISGPEVILARGGEANLKVRLDKENQEVTTQLQQTEQNFTLLNTNHININNDIGSGVRPVFKRLITEMKQHIQENVFNLGFIADTHCSEMTGVPHFSTQVHSLNHLTNFHSALGEADSLIYGGDNIACENPDIRVNNQMLNTFTSKVFDTKMKADRFMLKGNHDTYLPSTIVNETHLKTNTKIRPSQLMSDTETNGYYRSDVKLFNEVRKGDSLYFFKDYDNKKIRLIGLNTNDNPSIVDSDGYIKYFDMSYLGFRQVQLNWLANVALQNIPNGYDVVIVSHCPLTDSNLINGDIALGIIKSFHKGINYSGTGTTVDWQVNVTASFSHNVSHKVVGCFSGHWHKEQFNGLDDEIHVISLNASWYSGQNERSLANSNTTNKEDCWYLIGVDTTNKTVKIYGFDYGNDYEYNY